MVSEKRLREIEQRQQEHGELLVEIKTALIGIDGKNGLRSEVKEIKAEVDSLKAFKNRLIGYAAAFGLGSSAAFKWVTGG